MKIHFAKNVAAAAAAGLLGVACGDSMPEAGTPSAHGPAGSDPVTATSGEPTAEGGDEGAEGDKACCKGKNECEGKGGCSVAGKHDCQGKNECAGKGGCNMHCPKADG